jgi:hypothetical protein
MAIQLKRLSWIRLPHILHSVLVSLEASLLSFFGFGHEIRDNLAFEGVEESRVPFGPFFRKPLVIAGVVVENPKPKAPVCKPRYGVEFV